MLNQYLILHLPSRSFITPEWLRNFVHQYGEHGRLYLGTQADFIVQPVSEFVPAPVVPKTYTVAQLLFNPDFVFLPGLDQEAARLLEFPVQAMKIEELKLFLTNMITGASLVQYREMLSDERLEKLRPVIEELMRKLECRRRDAEDKMNP